MAAPSTGATGTAPPTTANLITVGRSDARQWTTEEIKARLAKDRTSRQVGEPIPEDPGQVADSEARKTLELWRVVAARGVAEELAWPRESQYQLAFPDGFCLRECTPPAAGSVREFGVYGHTAGCADQFVYHQPCEFIPHVLWLLSDSTSQRDCWCKPCHRATARPFGSFVVRLEAEIKALEDANPASKSTDSKALKKTKKKPPASTADTASKTATTTPPAKATKKTPTPKPAATSRTSQPQSNVAQAGPVATDPPHPSLNDEPTLFRRGEMVWCQQMAPQSGWRIGIIREVRLDTGAATRPYVIIGLAHNSIDIPDSEREVQYLRPFLTFSVPSINHPDLTGRGFSHVNWEQALINPQYNREATGLEASKLAALEVDGSWSTFNKIPAGQKQAKTVTTYGGAYLGAEMVRLGDPIRHKNKSKEELLEVTEICVTENIDPGPGQEQYELSFKGIEYGALLVPENAKIPVQPHGAIFTKDTAFRTLAAKAGGKKMKAAWQVRQLDSVWPEAVVAGRSYATNELLHVTKGADEVKTAETTGDFQEASAFLNNRMQTLSILGQGRRPNRWATYSQAVSEARQQLRVGDDIVEE